MTVQEKFKAMRPRLTLRSVNPGAEAAMHQEVRVLDKGYVKLVEYMGDDATIVRAARHSYGKQDREQDAEGNTKLIRFLMKHAHTSPFEQPALVFQVKAPIFVFREWHRHRTAKLNEMSARYTQLPMDFYVPAESRVQAQSTTNKQGSGEALGTPTADAFCYDLTNLCKSAYAYYESALEDGVARELARMMLPVNFYSVMVWQSDLSNLLKFLKLRMSEKAQFEIREYANAIATVVKNAFPITYEAFESCQL